MSLNLCIFLTDKGYSYQPYSESVEPAIENMQIIGFSSEKTSQDAFDNLLIENECLTGTTFDNVSCYKLDNSLTAIIFPKPWSWGHASCLRGHITKEYP